MVCPLHTEESPLIAPGVVFTVIDLMDAQPRLFV
jgi:hypothetical protein